MSISCKKPPFTRAIFIDRSKFCEQFLKRVTRGTFLWYYFKIWPAVSEKIFSEFLHVSIVREDPIHQSHVYGPIKISQTLLEEGHQRNIPEKLFQNLTSGLGEEESPKENSCEIISKSDQWFQRRRFLKNCLKSNFSANRFLYISNIIWIQFQNWKPYFNVLRKKWVISINVVCTPVRVCKIFDKTGCDVNAVRATRLLANGVSVIALFLTTVVIV